MQPELQTTVTCGPRGPGRCAPLTYRWAPRATGGRQGPSGRCWATQGAATTLAGTAYPSAAAGITANERFLFAPRAGLAHCACSVRRAASREPNERSPLRVLPGAGQGGDRGDRQHPGREPAGEMESGSEAAEAQQPGFPRQGGPRLSHTRTCEDGYMNQAVCRWGLGCSRIL